MIKKAAGLWTVPMIGFCIVFCVMASGCAVTHDYKQAKGIRDASIINIVDNPATRKGFLNAMTSWLGENGYEYSILPEGSNPEEKGWALTYTGRWSWDIAIYLAKATIEAYHNGVSAGNAKYSAGSASLDKFRNAEETVKKMMSNLFNGKTE